MIDINTSAPQQAKTPAAAVKIPATNASPSPAKDAVTTVPPTQTAPTASTAAKGNDDVMSQPATKTDTAAPK